MFLPPPQNNNNRPASALAGFAATALGAVAVCIIPLVNHEWIPIQVFTPQVISLAATPKKNVVLRRHARPAAAQQPGAGKAHPTPPAPSPAILSAPTNAIAALPGSGEWRHRAARGEQLDFELDAIDSLPVLKAHEIPLVFDTKRPRGATTLFNLGSRTVSISAIDSDAVLRIVTGMPPDALIDSLQAAAARRRGQPVLRLACYSAELYNALRGYAEALLSARGVEPGRVRHATVRLLHDGGRDFHVLLESFEI
jgi:hypothetical protein